MKTLILYYSLSGRTKTVAKTLASKISSDLIEINDLKDRKGLKSKIFSSIDAFRETKTKIAPARLDLEGYDLIYIGTPVWAGNPSPAVITAIDSFDFRRKDIILFATMRNSGGDAVIKRMEEKIQARGARVINSFSLKTQNKNQSQLIGDTHEIIDLLDLELYNKSF
ncbi:MAG: NAD(P)H-dependent oxidoreductase [Methanobrevibacter sp.]|jgi:flavodoxin|nr:NAD(P)H-dependent oxidoreductase [Methanobrevibacter sp.]